MVEASMDMLREVVGGRSATLGQAQGKVQSGMGYRRWPRHRRQVLAVLRRLPYFCAEPARLRSTLTCTLRSFTARLRP